MESGKEYINGGLNSKERGQEGNLEKDRRQVEAERWGNQ